MLAGSNQPGTGYVEFVGCNAAVGRGVELLAQRAQLKLYLATKVGSRTAAIELTFLGTRGEIKALRKIAPKRFNPNAEAWLPILHTSRDKWHFTALFSNTARAHELRKVQDWVVIYFHSDSGGEAQRTIVTETRGPLAGQRVVRGRERECLAVYESAPTREMKSPDGRVNDEKRRD